MMFMSNPQGVRRRSMRLWGVRHPYYCSESNYFSNEQHHMHSDWASFSDSMGASEPELNLLFRWDWSGSLLSTFWVLQRKGIFCCHEVRVTEADEPAVREWLEGRWQHVRALWEPLECAYDGEPILKEADHE